MTTLQRVERSIFKAIMAKFVAAGYTPDLSDVDNQNLAAYETALQEIANAKGLAVQIIGNRSSRAMDYKKVCGIVIKHQRIVTGDLGRDTKAGVYQQKENDPNNFEKIMPPLDSSDYYFDIHLIYSTTKQFYAITDLVGQALGRRNYLPMYDNPAERFFIQQFNYYDFPDSNDNIQEKIYSYEVKDLYEFEGVVDSNLSLIKEITVEIGTAASNTWMQNNLPNLVTETNESILINLSGISFT